MLKYLYILLLVLLLSADYAIGQTNWYCVYDCLEKQESELPGNAGPGQIIMTHPDYPNCSIFLTYKVWVCVEGSKVVYRLSITGWYPVNINDTGCVGLKAKIYPSGYPGPVDEMFVLGMFKKLAPLVSEYYFMNRSGYQTFYSCPNYFETQEYVQGACVKLVRSSYSNLQQTFTSDAFFKLASCSYLCCTTPIRHCYNR
jgi:hypothetical protein